nr:uncharacterized protein LOC129261486 [Lytechinus pictus]
MSLPSVDIGWLDSVPYKKRSRRQQEATKKPRGRPAVRTEFPGVVEAASQFVQSNGFKAHRRRQQEIGVCGSTLRDIRDHLQSTVPGLKGEHPNLNVRTIAHWMHPPNKAHKAAEKYTGLIQARIPAKDNSARKPNDNSHFYAARVRYSLEMASKFSEFVQVYSADNKNKIRIGDCTLAVDRRIRINRFFPVNDAPRYMDHDFPTPGYLLTPSGYLEMEPSLAPQIAMP